MYENFSVTLPVQEKTKLLGQVTDEEMKVLKVDEGIKVFKKCLFPPFLEVKLNG